MRQNPRALYRATFEEYRAAKAEREELYPIARKQVELLTHDIVRQNMPRGMRNTEENRAKVQRALEAELRARVDKLPSVTRYHALGHAIARLKEKLDAMAGMVPVKPGDRRALITEVDEGTYHTVGLGAASYARGSVRIRQKSIAAAYPNVRTEFITEERSSVLDPKRRRKVFVLVAFVAEEIDEDILSRAPGFGLKDYLQACWAEGCNPRVFNPMIPHGLEEKFGLDYFGNEKRKS